MKHSNTEVSLFLYGVYIGEQERLTGPSISFYNVHSDASIDCPSKRKFLERMHVGSTVSLEKLHGLVECVFIGQCRVSI